jgi:hypothetical protein
VALYKCENCEINLYADGGGQEECPKCGALMGEYFEEEDCTIPQREELARQEAELDRLEREGQTIRASYGSRTT